MPHALAILFSGGTDSLALWSMALFGHNKDLPKPSSVHLITMLNGMSRFPLFTENRFRMAREILEKQSPGLPAETRHAELDSGRIFQELWLDRYESLMPRFNGKNLVCVACKLAMHTRAILYCLEHRVPFLAAGYTAKQSFYPEQTPAFMERMQAFSRKFSIETRFPVYEAFSEERICRHYLEDQGLPSTGGGERKCLFSQTRTSATGKEIGDFIDFCLPVLEKYIFHRQEGNVAGAAKSFDTLDEI